MSLEGTIESFPIGEIFELVSHQRKTGVLEISTADGVAKLCFRDGILVEAWPDKRGPAALIGGMLIRAGLITPAQLGHALDRQRDSLRRIGDILIRMGAIRISEFQEILALQQREVVYRLLQLKRGSYRFVPRAVELEHGVSIPMEVGMLLMEGFRQIDEWPNLLAKIPSEKQIYTKAPGAPQPEDLSTDQIKVLTLVDGTASVREIVDRSRLGEFSAWNALASLFDRGLIEPTGTVRRLPAKPEAPQTNRAADAIASLVLVALAGALLALSFGSERGSLDRLNRAVDAARMEAVHAARRVEGSNETRSRLWSMAGAER